MRHALSSLLALLGLGLLGCAPALEPVRLRAADLGHLTEPLDPAKRPIVVEFAAGESIPIDLTLAADLVELVPDKPGLSLKVRRRFFVRLDGNGLKTSLDGVDFGKRPLAPGRFQLGLGLSKQGAKVDIHIHAPTHAGAEQAP